MDPNVLVVIRAESAAEVEKLLAESVWTQMGLLETLSIEPWGGAARSLDQTSSTSRP